MKKQPQIHQAIRDRLLAQAGLSELPKGRFPLADLKTYQHLWHSEWSTEFEHHMRRRMIMGSMRYDTLAVKRLKRGKYELLEPIRKKIALYKQTGNTEYLVDIANYCMIAYECDDHPKKNFTALDDHHDHCKLK